MTSPDALLLRAVQAFYDWLLDEFGVLVGHYRLGALVLSWAVWISLAVITPGYWDIPVTVAFCIIMGLDRFPEYLHRDNLLQRSGRYAALNVKAMRQTALARGMGFLAGMSLLILCCTPLEWTGLFTLYGAWLTEAVLVRERQPSPNLRSSPWGAAASG